METARRALGLALAIALVIIFLAPGARADMERPTWTAGDFWEYTFTGLPFGDGGIGGPAPTGSLRVAVTGTDSVTVGGTTYTAYRATMAFNLTMSSGGITITIGIGGEEWYRTSDMGLVKQTLTIPDFFGAGQFSVTSTYAPPQQMNWPLKAGATWTATSLVTSTTTTQFGTQTDSGTESTSFSVQAETSTTVPAGTYNAYPVRGTDVDGSYAMNFWSAAVGNAVRMQAFDDANQQMMSGDLRTYQYQAAGLFGASGVLLLLLLLLVVIIVIVAALAMRRRRRGAVVPYGPAPSMTYQQPMPPSPPQQPGPPPPPGAPP